MLGGYELVAVLDLHDVSVAERLPADAGKIVTGGIDGGEVQRAAVDRDLGVRARGDAAGGRKVRTPQGSAPGNARSG